MAKTVANYITNFRQDNPVKTGQLSDDIALERFNRYYHKLENKIAVFLQENYFTETITANLVDGTNAYPLPTGDSDADDTAAREFKKMLSVSIKYDTNYTYYKKAKLQDVGNLEKDISWYAENQSEEDPFFIFDNNNLIIYPTPTSNVTDGLKFIYARTEKDVLSTDSESDLSIPRQYIHIILVGMKIPYHQARGDINAKNDAIAEFEREVNNAMSEISDRYIKPIE
jgi:hypothetical protein